ncbi:MAG: hypothetical protein HOY71_46185 [Nonomuraea sp.]|nr:hypothetical protein [Nonomuraea sp.]
MTTLMSPRLRRVCALFLLAVSTVITIGLVSSPAQAQPRVDIWYRCYIPDHGWMWCLDV